MGKITAEMLRLFSSSLILPFDVTVYGTELQNYFNNFEKTYGSKLKSLNISLSSLETIVAKFKTETIDFSQRVASINRKK